MSIHVLDDFLSHFSILPDSIILLSSTPITIISRKANCKYLMTVANNEINRAVRFRIILPNFAQQNISSSPLRTIHRQIWELIS